MIRCSFRIAFNGQIQISQGIYGFIKSKIYLNHSCQHGIIFRIFFKSVSESLQRTYRIFIFFFQAEDGIRGADVTGVQTCALPISETSPPWVSMIGSAVSEPVLPFTSPLVNFSTYSTLTRAARSSRREWR